MTFLGAFLHSLNMKETIKIPTIVTIKPEIRFGKPCIKGTRIAIADILNLIRAGYAINDIPSQYPPITLRDAKTAIQYAVNILGKEEVLTII